MTIVDLKTSKQKIQNKEFKQNLDCLLIFCEASLKLFTSKDVAIIPQNDEGVKKLNDFLKLCKQLGGKK